MALEHSTADTLVQAAIDARGVRWEGKTANLPIEQTGVTPAASVRAETGTWYL